MSAAACCDVICVLIQTVHLVEGVDPYTTNEGALLNAESAIQVSSNHIYTFLSTQGGKSLSDDLTGCNVTTCHGGLLIKSYAILSLTNCRADSLNS